MPLEFDVTAPQGKKTVTFWVLTTDNTNTIREVGLFNASSSGTMLVRRVMHQDIVMDGANYAYMIEIEIAGEDL